MTHQVPLPHDCLMPMRFHLGDNEIHLLKSVRDWLDDNLVGDCNFIDTHDGGEAWWTERFEAKGWTVKREPAALKVKDHRGQIITVTSPTRPCLDFERAEDAVLFKMTWC